MKHFTDQLFSRWYALMTPAYSPLTTLKERETMRKRRLLSIMLLFGLLVLSGYMVIITLFKSFNISMQLPLLLCFCCLSLSLWLNQRGYLHCASLCYLLISFIVSVMTALSLSSSIPSVSLIIWTAQLILPVISILFLPVWGPPLMTVVIELFICWFMLIGRQSQIALTITNPDHRLFILTNILVVVSIVGAYCTLVAATSKNAIIKADRAEEIEHTNHALTHAYTGLEAAHNELATAHAVIQQQALTDGLTGLPNHRAVMDQLEKELDRARRYNCPFSLLFFDADHFKRVNDTHGHAAGDAVLRQIGERARSFSRGGDTVGRFGGEEFVILLPEANAHEASIVAERIRGAVAARPINASEVPEGIPMTISIGLTSYPDDGDTEQVLLAQADEAMYVAKRLGRNQVRTAEEARQIQADLELMALLQKEEQQEAALREGVTPVQQKEMYALRMIHSLMSLLERRDPNLYAHAHAVSKLTIDIAQTMQMEATEVSHIGMAALVHDIGQVAIPDMILQKAGHLSQQERVLLKEHAELGALILEASPFLDHLVPAIRHHHEHWNGSGYPHQLAGATIPLSARIISVAETYDMMLRDRPYQIRRTTQEAIVELQRCSGTQFDPAVVLALLDVVTSEKDKSAQIQTALRAAS